MSSYLDYYDRSLVRLDVSSLLPIYGTLFQSGQPARFFIVTCFFFAEKPSSLSLSWPASSNPMQSYLCRVVGLESKIIDERKITLLEVVFEKGPRFCEGLIFRVGYEIDFSSTPEDISSEHSGGSTYYWDLSYNELVDKDVVTFKRKTLFEKLSLVDSAGPVYEGIFQKGTVGGDSPIVYGGGIRSYGPVTHLGNAYVLGFVTKVTYPTEYDGIKLRFIGLKAISDLYAKFSSKRGL